MRRSIRGLPAAAINGHVDWLSAADYNRVLNKTQGPLWCNPKFATGQ